MAVIEKYTVGTAATVLTTELNSLANNTQDVSTSTYDNRVGYSGDGSSRALVEAVFTYDTAPTAYTFLSVWFLRLIDGTNYEDGSSSITPSRPPDVSIPVRAVTSAQRVTLAATLPPGKFYTLVRNDGTGQTLASSGNVISILPFTRGGY